MRTYFGIRSVGLVAASLGLAACATDRVQYGGVMARTTPPAAATQCYQAGWAPAERSAPVYPRDLLEFVTYGQFGDDERDLVFSYDIDRSGRPRNIRFVSPERYLEHRATQRAILAAAEALAEWRYQQTEAGPPNYGAGCAVQFSFIFEGGPSK